jgi:hypothetical protein
MSAEYAKRGSFGIVRKDTSGFGLELLCEARPVPDPNGLNRPSAPALRRLLHLSVQPEGRLGTPDFWDNKLVRREPQAPQNSQNCKCAAVQTRIS